MVTSGLFLNTRVAVEITMHDVQQPTRFDALEKATTAAGIAISLVIRAPELCFLVALPT
jgi:hypothetical protein